MDEFNLDQLDIDAAESIVQQRSAEEAAQVFVPGDDDECEGGACKI